MRTVNIDDAKAQLSQLIDEAAKGKPFIIAKAGRPMVKVTALGAHIGVRRLGFLRGQFSIPEDFNGLGCTKIDRLFSGGRWSGRG